MCLEYDINGKLIRFDTFIEFINERLGDNYNRHGIQDLFQKLMDPKIKEITPKKLYEMTQDFGHDLSLKDCEYLLDRISGGVDININSDEFYYLMTKRPVDIDVLAPLTKSAQDY